MVIDVRPKDYWFKPRNCYLMLCVFFNYTRHLPTLSHTTQLKLDTGLGWGLTGDGRMESMTTETGEKHLSYAP